MFFNANLSPPLTPNHTTNERFFSSLSDVGAKLQGDEKGGRRAVSSQRCLPKTSSKKVPTSKIPPPHKKRMGRHISADVDVAIDSVKK